MTHVEAIASANLRLDGGTQPRTALNMAVVEDYSTAMGAGAQFPPVMVFYDGADYWLADGFHRVKAASAASRDTIECEVRQGRLEDAQWYSFGANKTNGLRRTNRDKCRAVESALTHPKGFGLSDRQIGNHIGVDHKTVGAWRAKLQSTGEIPQSKMRTGSDGRTIKTAKIGKSAPVARHNPAPPPQTTHLGTSNSTRTTRSQRIDHLARLTLSLIEATRHFAQLVGWLGETAGEFDEAELLLSNAINPIVAVNAELERKAIAADPLNATRLGIQENKS
jgi:hypothetical protein